MYKIGSPGIPRSTFNFDAYVMRLLPLNLEHLHTDLTASCPVLPNMYSMGGCTIALTVSVLQYGTCCSALELENVSSTLKCCTYNGVAYKKDRKW